MTSSLRAFTLMALAAALAFAPAAVAEPVSDQQFEQLVQQAYDRDQAALERLRQVDSVDGQQVNMRRALDAEGRELRERLRALRGDGVSGSSGNAPREEAKDILSGGDYKQSEPPRPFKGPLERLGDWLEDLISGVTFGNSPLGWVVLAALVAGIVGVIAMLIARRRVGTAASREGSGAQAEAEDPAELERLADRAEKAGDYSAAVRLRYRAGLLRLGDRQAIDYRPSLTAHQVSDQLHSPRYDELADRFEDVAYGAQEATAEDSARAASEWREVVKESKR